MARTAATGDTVTVRPSNNVYTVLAVIGTIATALGLLVLFMRGDVVGGLM